MVVGARVPDAVARESTSAPVPSRDALPAADGDVTPVTRSRPLVLGAAWALLSLVVVLVVFGGPGRRVHQSPDEAATATAVTLVATTRLPRLDLDVAPVEGLLRPRLWALVADPADPPGHLTPGYPTVPYLLFGLPRALPLGDWLLLLVPALGLGAAVAALAHHLPAGRRWVAALAPLVAWPATYWWLRPWHNTASMLGLAGLAALAASWHVRRTLPGERAPSSSPAAPRSHLPSAALAAGLAATAAAARPDQVHLLLGATLALVLAVAPRRHDRFAVVGIHAVAAVGWLVAVLAGNVAATGSALTSPNELLDFPDEVRPFSARFPTPWRQLLTIVARRGLPAPDDLAAAAVRYVFAWGPLPVVTVVGLGAVLVVAWRQRRRWRTAAGIAVLLTVVNLVVYAATRVSDADFGGSLGGAGLVHSYARYVVLVHVAIGATVVAVLARTNSRAGPALLAIAALAGGLWLTVPRGDEETLAWLAAQLRQGDALATAVDELAPSDAVVFTLRTDKYVAGVRRVALLQRERPEPGAARVDVAATVANVATLVAAGHPVVLLEVTDAEAAAIDAGLAAHGLALRTERARLPEVRGVPVLPLREVVASG